MSTSESRDDLEIDERLISDLIAAESESDVVRLLRFTPVDLSRNRETGEAAMDRRYLEQALQVLRETHPRETRIWETLQRGHLWEDEPATAERIYEQALVLMADLPQPDYDELVLRALDQISRTTPVPERVGRRLTAMHTGQSTPPRMDPMLMPDEEFRPNKAKK